MRLLMTAAIVIVCCAQAAEANEWWLVTVSGDRSTYFVDVSSVDRRGDGVGFVYNEQLNQKVKQDNIKSDFRSFEYKAYVDCTKRLFGYSTAIAMSKKEFPATFIFEGGLRSVETESFAVALLGFVCAAPDERPKLGKRIFTSPEKFTSGTFLRPRIGDN